MKPDGSHTVLQSDRKIVIWSWKMCSAIRLRSKNILLTRAKKASEDDRLEYIWIYYKPLYSTNHFKVTPALTKC